MKRFVSSGIVQEREHTRVEIVLDEKTGQKALAKSVSLLADPRIIQAHRMEIEVLSCLHSPFVPSLLDVFEEDGRFWLVESYIEGESLQEWLKCRPKRKKRRKVIEQLRLLLLQLHQAGFLYIDLKEENIRMVKDCPVLIDFNACIRLYQKKVYLASTAFAAEELFTDLPKTPAADVYAFGFLVQKLLPAPRWCYRRFFAPLHRRLADMEEAGRLLRRQKWLPRWIGGGLLSVFIFLFLLFPSSTAGYSYQRSRDPMYFTADFEKELESKQISDVFFSWIEKDLLDDALFSDPQTACFLAAKAAESSNPSICGYILSRLPDDSLMQQPALELLLKACASSAFIDESLLDQCLTKILTQEEKEQAAKILLSLSLNKEVLLEEKKLQLLMEETHGFSLNTLFLEYMLQNADTSPSLVFKEEWLCPGSEKEEQLWKLWREYVNCTST